MRKAGEQERYTQRFWQMVSTFSVTTDFFNNKAEERRKYEKP
jgi:hypothetical protein